MSARLQGLLAHACIKWTNLCSAAIMCRSLITNVWKSWAQSLYYLNLLPVPSEPRMRCLLSWIPSWNCSLLEKMRSYIRWSATISGLWTRNVGLEVMTIVGPDALESHTTLHSQCNSPCPTPFGNFSFPYFPYRAWRNETAQWRKFFLEARFSFSSEIILSRARSTATPRSRQFFEATMILTMVAPLLSE